MITIHHLITILDLIGVVACSVAASILAQRKGLDIAGAFFISTVGAIGGGTVRDILLNHHPIFWLHQTYYLVAIIISSVLTLIFYRMIIRLNRALITFDAIGLAAFTVIGVEIATGQNMSPFIAVIMGIITATVGGILRDIICNELPLVLHKEIYITASLIGGCVLITLMRLGVGKEIAYTISLISIFGIRMFAVHNDLCLPRFNQDETSSS